MLACNRDTPNTSPRYSVRSMSAVSLSGVCRPNVRTLRIVYSVGWATPLIVNASFESGPTQLVATATSGGLTSAGSRKLPQYAQVVRAESFFLPQLGQVTIRRSGFKAVSVPYLVLWS